MKNKTNVIAAAIVTVLPVIFGIINYQKLPNKLPIHFNGSNQPDNFAPKALVVFGIPVLMLLLLIFIVWSIQKSQAKQTIDNNLMIWIIPVTMIIFYPTSILAGLGYQLPIGLIAIFTIAILLIITLISYLIAQKKTN